MWENDWIINKSVYFDILEKRKKFKWKWPGTVDDPKLSSSLYKCITCHAFETRIEKKQQLLNIILFIF